MTEGDLLKAVLNRTDGPHFQLSDIVARMTS